MWNFIKGVNPPIKKRKTEDRTLCNSEYESSKRVVRSYCTEWEKDRPWLKLTDDGMVCLACQAHGDKTVMYQFINGCVTYKLDSIQKHQKSKGHEKSLLIEKAKNESKAESKVEEQEECMETDDEDVVIQLKATGCDLPVKETIKLSTSTKSNHIEHPYHVPSINMGYSSKSDRRIDEMNSNKVQPIKGNSDKCKRKMEKVTSSESTPLMLMVSSHAKNTNSIIVPVKSEILKQLQSEVFPSCLNPNFQMSVCSRPSTVESSGSNVNNICSYRPSTVESSGSNVNNICLESQNLGSVAHDNNSGLINNIKQEPVDDYFITNVYNESQDSTQNSVVNNDSQTSSFSPIIYGNVNSNDHNRKIKEVTSSSILNKTHVNQENQSSTPTMVFRHAKNMQKTTISDSMGGNSSHNMGDNSSHNTEGNSTTILFSNQVKVPRLQTKDSGTDRLNGNQSSEPELDNTDWRNNCVNFLKDALQNTMNRLEDLGVEVAAWVHIPNNDKSSLIHHMGSQKGREFIKGKPDIDAELHLFMQNYKKKDNGKKNNSKEISKKKLEEDSCSVETSSCDGEPPESISENKAIPCSSLDDCKPTSVLFSVKGLDDNSSCIVVRQADDSSKEELQVNTPYTSSSNEKEKILLKRKISSVDTDPLSDDKILSESSKEEKASLVKTCKDIFADNKKVELNYINHHAVWLTANIKEDRTGKISLQDIQSKMGISISSVGLGRLMVKLYPGVKCKQERLKSEWNKRECVFHGVKWRA